MSRAVGYRWHLRLRMAERGMFATTELGPLLAERGVVLSREQVYRLAAGTPERLSLHTLAVLCDILDCSPSDLIEPVTKPDPAPGALSARNQLQRRIFHATCGPSELASSSTPRTSGERRRRPVVRPVRAGAADIQTGWPGRARYLLELLAATDRGMHGLRTGTPLQRCRGRTPGLQPLPHP